MSQCVTTHVTSNDFPSIFLYNLLESSKIFDVVQHGGHTHFYLVSMVTGRHDAFNQGYENTDKSISTVIPVPAMNFESK